MDKLASHSREIADVKRREGGDTATNDPDDAGGRTQYGISERAHPEVWADGVVTDAEATQVFRDQYMRETHIAEIPYPALRAQLFDWAVHSGPSIPIRALQRLVGTKPDGVLGPRTLAAVTAQDPLALNNALVQARVAFLENLILKRPRNQKYRRGWLRRARSFTLSPNLPGVSA